MCPIKADAVSETWRQFDILLPRYGDKAEAVLGCCETWCALGPSNEGTGLKVSVIVQQCFFDIFRFFKLKERAEEVHVIDIGTGTGLLSMMAARAGADRVTALEMFKPMVDCAKKIFHRNGFDKRVRLIDSRSTDIVHEGNSA